MSSFATEFPIRSITERAQFAAQVVAWLKGTKYSRVFEAPHEADLQGDTPHLRTFDGEELRFREFFDDSGLNAVGFRHDFPDDAGRVWRTEAVLRRETPVNGQDLIRIRTQCLAKTHEASLEFPRKPYFIKMLLSDEWGGLDGSLRVSDRPYWLKDCEEDLQLAHSATIGHATRHLPIVYISSIGTSSKWVATTAQIDKLAFDLGGIAHVVVEPGRKFSFRLRDISEGTNPYGGTIAIAAPSRGVIRRLFLGFRSPDIEDLLKLVRHTVTNTRTQMPAEGWDWTELQEQALRRQRERDRSKLNAEETEQLYKEEIANLQDRISQLEEQISSNAQQVVADLDDEQFFGALSKKVGPEIYRGEFSDRLRFAVRQCVKRAEQDGLDRRSQFVLGKIADSLPTSPELSELVNDLKQATKDPRRLASELKSLLSRHGYREKSDNKHIRLEPKEEYHGLDNITLMKTPSDSHGLANQRKQIERTLGISRLSD